MDYPLSCDPDAAYVGSDDIWQYWEDLNGRSPDVFVTNPSNVDLKVLIQPKREERASFPLRVDMNSGPDPTDSLVIRSVQELETLLENEETKSKTCFLWSNIAVEFLEPAETYSRDVRISMHRPSDSPKDAILVFQNLNRVNKETPNRQLEDPWSRRRTAIYQKLIPQKQQSLWLLIQAPDPFKQLLQKLLTKSTSLQGHPMALHLRYLRFCGKNWREFLAYMNEQLSLLDRKTAFPGKYEEFGVDFSVIQKLQSLRCRLNEARSIIGTTIDVTTVICNHSAALKSFASTSPLLEQYFQNEMRQVSLDLRNHARIVEEMFRFSEDIRLMSHKTLELWNSDLIHENGLSLKQLAFMEATERRLLSRFAEETSKDSKRMKIATVIATCYLPANLVLAFFSTDLVRVDDGKGSVVIKGQIWVAFLMSAILIALTVGSASFWYQPQLMQHKKSRPLAQP